MTPTLKDIDAWELICARRALFELQEGNKSSGNSSLFVNGGRLSPLTLYCYLKGRFGPPNGFQMALKKQNDSDNLIHWHYHIVSGPESLQIFGMNTRVEFWGNTQNAYSDSDWEILLDMIKSDFKNQGSKISEVRKSLEHWNLFINPFARLKRIVEQGRKRLSETDLTLSPPERAIPEKQPDRFKEELENYIRNIHEAAFLCTNLRMVAPVYAESFVNLLIFLLSKKEIKDDERLYQDLVRKQIDVRVKSLPHYCQGFVRNPSDNDESFKSFLRLMNKRNDVLHGNVDPMSLKFDEVWFDEYTPLFKDEKPFSERATYHLLKHIEPSEVLADIDIVESFIEYLLNLLDPEIKEQVERLSEDSYPGWREDTKRVGVLFPDAVVDMVPVAGTTDEDS
jgi:DNA-binding transcriptional MerR regulator